MSPTASCVLTTVWSPLRAAAPVSPAICATRCALSAIWREVASSSLMVVVISLMAVACSLAPVACWLAAACSSADELCTCWTAEPIWRRERRVMTNAGARHEQRGTSSVPDEDGRSRAASRRPRPRRRARWSRSRSSRSISPRMRAKLVHGALAFAARDDLPRSARSRRSAAGRWSASARRASASTSGSSSSRRFCWLGLSAVSSRSSASVVGQRADGRCVGLEVRLVAGDDEAALAGLGVLDQAEHVGEVLEDDVRVRRPRSWSA